MTTTTQNIDIQKSKPQEFSSNALRLSGTEWLWTLGICLTILIGLPLLGTAGEDFEPDSDYRVPYRLGYDYYHFQRYSHWATNQYEILMIGDSVLWGNYVTPDTTLTHYLNHHAGGQPFANLAINGIHPMALAGLLEYYGAGIEGKKVILNFNPLWLSSPNADLQTDKETRINHAELIPQWDFSIACYKETKENRLEIMLERNLRLQQWTNHLQICYFDSMSLPQWSLNYPYHNPLAQINLKLPEPKNEPHDPPVPWNVKSDRQINLPWMELETSLQWKFFRKAIQVLQARKNQIFVLVGPFNEHMLTLENKNTYRKIQAGIENWLRKNEIPYFMPDALPSEYYADASHPLAKGYEILAKQLYNYSQFQTIIMEAKSNESK
jgi:hypothetical protein